MIDAFTDLDLVAQAEIHRAAFADFPASACRIAEGLPPSPWLYGGGLENEPEVVERISRRHRLVGNPPETLRRARDPGVLSELFGRSGFASPTLSDLYLLPSNRGRRLLKPRKSAGGIGIRFLAEGEAFDPATHYAQAFCEGEALGGLFLATGSTCRLLGVFAALPSQYGFLYTGSVGPIEVQGEATQEIERAGRVASEGLGLVGLFGIDFIRRGEIVHPIEINPRPTATLELIEFASGRPVLADHLEAFGLIGKRVDANPTGCAAKRVVYAESALVVPDAPPSHPFDLDPWSSRTRHDIPTPGSKIAVGEPVLTLLVVGPNPAECLERLAYAERAFAEEAHSWRA